MKRLLMALGLCLFLGATNASAMGMTPTYEIGYSSMAVQGVIVTTGTVIQINENRPTPLRGRIAGYLIQNQDTADSVWITNADGEAGAGNGLEIAPGASWKVMLGRDTTRAGATAAKTAPIYAEADSAAGAAGAQIVLVWFFY
jgi:hypothetical protein